MCLMEVKSNVNIPFHGLGSDGAGLGVENYDRAGLDMRCTFEVMKPCIC